MAKSASFLLRLTLVGAALSLSACGDASTNNLAAIDEEILANEANDADPALTAALEDQILVDPTLAQQADRNAVRPSETPARASYPLPEAAATAAAPRVGTVQRASAETAGCTNCTGGAAGGIARGGSACGAAFEYGAVWAERLPPAFPPYPGGRVTEAAGNDAGECRLRVVTFLTSDDPRRVLDHYRGHAMRGGYSADHQMRGQDLVLGGVNKADGGAYYLIVTPKAGGSEVALIVNNGR